VHGVDVAADRVDERAEVDMFLRVPDADAVPAEPRPPVAAATW
jgi:hypothetical protein